MTQPKREPPKILHGPYGDRWAFHVDLGPGTYTMGWRGADNEEEALREAREEIVRWHRDASQAVIDRVTVPRRPPRCGGMEETQGCYEAESVYLPFGGACPVQGEGRVDGCSAYYRARGATWSLEVTLSENETWEYSEMPYAWPDAGWLHREESYANLARAVDAFRKRHRSGS